MKKILILMLFLIGCTSSERPKVIGILETEYFPVKAEVDGVPFNKLSVNDLIKLEDFNQVKITPTQKPVMNQIPRTPSMAEAGYNG